MISDDETITFERTGPECARFPAPPAANEAIRTLNLVCIPCCIRNSRFSVLIAHSMLPSPVPGSLSGE